MRTIGHFSTVANDGNDLACIYKCTKFFIKFCIVLIDRDQVGAMLDHQYVAAVLCPVRKDNRAVGNTLNRFVCFCYHINTKMSLLYIVSVRDKPVDRRKEKCLLKLPVLHV